MPRQTLCATPHDLLESWPVNASDVPVFSDESAQDVYRVSCVQIATALQSFRFKYYKGRQHCDRIDGRFANSIVFKSSHFNQSGRSVKLWMHAKVASPELQAWRAKRLPPEIVTDHVAGGMAHRLGTRFAMVQWELADPNDREETIQDAIEFIQAEVFPYFSRFEKPEALASILAVESVPALELVPSVEFAYCFGSKALAQETLNRFIRERAHLQDAIAMEQSNPSPSAFLHPTNYAQEVVFLRSRYELD